MTIGARRGAGNVFKEEEMKSKIIGMAVMAAMALMAFASSASATIVCSGEGTGPVCAGTHGKQYSGKIHATLKAGTHANLTVTNSSGGSVTTVTCTGSTVEGTVNGATGAGQITTFHFTGCSSPLCPNGVHASTTASAVAPWPAQATTSGTGPNGTLHVEKIGGKFICTGSFFNTTCEYASAKATVNVTGGAPATITATSVPLTKTAGAEAVCGVKADWTATYTVGTPSSLYLT